MPSSPTKNKMRPEMRNSWYAELSGVHYKMGQWWVPEREENGILLYRGSEERPAGAVQKLTKAQEKIFYEKEEDWAFALDDNEWKGDEPVFVSFLYREGKEVGFIREYFGKRVRVVKRYMYADYGGRDAALRESFRDDAFRSFLNRHVYGCSG